VFSARAAVPGDLDTIVALARQAVDELALGRGGAVWRRVEARQEPLAPALAAAIDASGPEGDHMVVVGTVDDVPLGYGVVHRRDLPDGTALATVDDLYVDPGARGVGVGEAVMDLLIETAARWRCTGIEAMALPGDRHTKNFFERFGLTARAILVHRSLDSLDPEPASPEP
jgi:GNAT superfamily N-acetyltransferase